MKIGLVTIYTVPNYGSVLQAYATQVVLEKLGHDCRIIDYEYPNEWHYQQGAPPQSWIRKMIVKLGLKKHHRKSNKLCSFRSKYFHYTKHYKSLDELEKEKWRDFDAFVVGSDQVWNPRFLKGDKVFLLSFAPSGKPRFSIASSFSTDELPQKYLDKYKKELSKFAALSVRESEGVKVINNQLGIIKEVAVCLDPTLLLDKEDWFNLVPRSGFKKKRPFILLYLLTYAFDPSQYAYNITNQLAKQMNITDVVVLAGNPSEMNNSYLKIHDVTDSSISEFIDYFQYADAVVTSSFHGTAFALNFGRPLLSVVQSNSGDSRQENLLMRIGAETSIVKIGKEYSVLTAEYDVDKILRNLSVLRNENIDWIKSHIKA